MFEVDAKRGFSTFERKMTEDMFDEVFWPEILGDQKRIRNNSIDRQTPPFPENGFKLNLAIRYDKLFSAKFPGTEKIRYVLILDFFYMNCYAQKYTVKNYK